MTGHSSDERWLPPTIREKVFQFYLMLVVVLSCITGLIDPDAYNQALKAAYPNWYIGYNIILLMAASMCVMAAFVHVETSLVIETIGLWIFAGATFMWAIAATSFGFTVPGTPILYGFTIASLARIWQIRRDTRTFLKRQAIRDALD